MSIRLSSRNIPETTTASLIELIDECEFAKYAPSAAHDSMGGVFDKATSVIGSLENSFKK